MFWNNQVRAFELKNITLEIIQFKKNTNMRVKKFLLERNNLRNTFMNLTKNKEISLVTTSNKKIKQLLTTLCLEHLSHSL